MLGLRTYMVQGNREDCMGLFFGKDKVKPKEKLFPFSIKKAASVKQRWHFNVAHALARQEKRVLCLDMDPQANLSLLCSRGVSLKKDNHIFHLLINSIRELKALHTPSVFTDVVVRR